MNYELTDLQRYILLLLSLKNNEPIKGKLWLQKELFLLAKNISKLEREASFEPDFIGPFSENADEELEELKLDDFIDIDRKIRITEDGKNIIKKIQNSFSKEEIELANNIKDFLNDLPEDELLAFVYFSYPEMAQESLVKKGVEKERIELAINLYKKNKVSIEKASEIAGIPIEKFMKLLQ